MGLVTANDSPQTIGIQYYSPQNLETPVGAGGNVPGNVVEISIQNINMGFLLPLTGAATAGMPMVQNASATQVRIFSSGIMGGYPLNVTSVPR
jgi:hypothetical protein